MVFMLSAMAQRLMSFLTMTDLVFILRNAKRRFITNLEEMIA